MLSSFKTVNNPNRIRCCFQTASQCSPNNSLCRFSSASRHSSGKTNNDTQQQQQQDALFHEAKSLTLRLYRSVVRSVRMIRHGNAHDELEFQAREEQERAKKTERANRASTSGSSSSFSNLSMISLLPPVDRVDELRSRAEYYQQYARENFVQESDSLKQRGHVNSRTRSRSRSTVIWEERDVTRFVYLLKRGEDHRRWLLSDMKFDNEPCVTSFDLDAVHSFERRALDHVRQAKVQRMKDKLSPEAFQSYLDRQQETHSGSTTSGDPNNDTYDDDNTFDDWDDWSSDEDDESPSGLPSWYKNPRST